MLTKKNVLALGGASLVLAAIHHFQKIKKSREEIEQQLMKIGRHLKHQSSIDRRRLIQGDIEYKLAIQLEKGKVYRGIVQINLNLNQQDYLFIDFESITGKVVEVVLNGQKQTQIKWNHYFIVLDKKYLNKGSNSICIHFENEYTHDGEGIHSFEDLDQKQYIYTFFAPAYCRKWIPCIDQPDIKGYLKMYTFIPNDWIAISNESLIEQPYQLSQLVSKTSELDGMFTSFNIRISTMIIDDEKMKEYRMWHFKKTDKISTYLFNLCVGPYREIKNDSVIPMSLFCRSNLYEALEKQKHIFFETVEKCMIFYECFFKCKFPFSKYDMIFCPQFEMGAMENVGAVTINDNYIYRDTVSRDKIAYLVVLMTHELCHMWFGNLVTMKWWNDIWLNESFADFFSFYAASQLDLSFGPFDFNYLFNQRKDWGYDTDMSGIKQSIDQKIQDTQQARTVFDGITYSKGASVLKQLSFIIGYDNLSRAMNTYFEKYKYQNITLNDFINTLDQYFDNPHFNLQEWKQQWIQTHGCSSLEPTIDHLNQQIIIHQTNGLRDHKIRIALYKYDQSFTTLDVFIKAQKSTQIKLDSIEQYQAILLNYDDYDFCKVILDDKSRQFFSSNFRVISSPLNQRVFSRALFEMVKDAKISSLKYLEFTVNSIGLDLSQDIIQTTFQNLLICLQRFTPSKYQEQMYDQIYELIKTMLIELNGSAESGKQVMLINSLIQYARSDRNVKELLQLYRSEISIGDIKLSLYDKWNIVMKIILYSQIPTEQKHHLITEQLQLDQNEKQKTICMLILEEDKEAIQQQWQSFLNPEGKQNQVVYAQMTGFNIQSRQLKQYHNEFFSNLIPIYQNQAVSYSQNFFQLLFPITEDFQYLIQKIDECIDSIDQFKFNGKGDLVKLSILNKQLIIKMDLIKRRESAYECFIQENEVY